MKENVSGCFFLNTVYISLAEYIIYIFDNNSRLGLPSFYFAIREFLSLPLCPLPVLTSPPFHLPSYNGKSRNYTVSELRRIKG